MAKKSFINRFFEWQNYMHYIMLAILIFPIHWLTGVTGVEQAAVAMGGLHWLWLMLFYAAGLLVADSIIHAIFWYGPKWLRWRD